ncbi:hypothetical protein IU500_18870 [Nocardia terpenica]|nr:hypothetical protein [Nocardia terpenica]MBF6063548.1 hypothetical protein [Nocardia terpenica]MBF6106104.1 hypothetical protein [Nocardia terpenica]MBF6113311.1 hypothetical protein [Nocardia terpenica]MBF6119845.1 hypothetical protein [Nocardia terpenica]MBF6152256.1 hypothetical protein [Nocardia terpenica]
MRQLLVENAHQIAVRADVAVGDLGVDEKDTRRIGSPSNADLAHNLGDFCQRGKIAGRQDIEAEYALDAHPYTRPPPACRIRTSSNPRCGMTPIQRGSDAITAPESSSGNTAEPSSHGRQQPCGDGTSYARPAPGLTGAEPDSGNVSSRTGTS